MNNLTIEDIKNLEIEVSCSPVTIGTFKLCQLFTEEYLVGVMEHIKDIFEDSTPTTDEYIEELEDIIYPEILECLDIQLKS